MNDRSLLVFAIIYEYGLVVKQTLRRDFSFHCLVIIARNDEVNLARVVANHSLLKLLQYGLSNTDEKRQYRIF